MRRKISVKDLTVDMYITDLDRPWVQAPFEPPFEFQGFKVSDQEELEKVNKLCEYVYIDPKFGKEADSYLPDTYGLKDITQVFVSLSSSSAPAVYKGETPLVEEVPMARKVLSKANDMYVQIVGNIRQGRQINEGELQNVITELVESVARNPAALAWLVGQQEKSSLAYVSPISITALALTLGRSMRLSRELMEVLGAATMLQDVGMLAMPSEIINKKGPLTAAETEVLKGHVDASLKMLAQAGNFPPEVTQVVQKHHERRDGSGYPRAISGDDIGTLSTISGIVDSYQSGTSERPYRKAKTSFQVLMELYGERGHTFESTVVEHFIQCIGIFPIGSFVELNTREVGVVINRHPTQQLKPTIQIVIDPAGERIKEPETVDLAKQRNEEGQPARLITKVIDPEEKKLDVSGILA
jgi:HD-GYP domain-containing protein (c-di-GMP phosphodiesterase class II)